MSMRMIDADALYRTVTLLWETSDEEDFEKGVFAAMENAPTIKPRKGMWIERTVSRVKAIDEWQSARCSVCGLYHTTPYLYYFNHYNYCPNCGARIEKNEM